MRKLKNSEDQAKIELILPQLTLGITTDQISQSVKLRMHYLFRYKCILSILKQLILKHTYKSLLPEVYRQKKKKNNSLISVKSWWLEMVTQGDFVS